MVSRVWDRLRQSRTNLASALANYREGLYEEVCFEAYQAGERVVKGLLSFLHKERRGSITLILSESRL